MKRCIYLLLLLSLYAFAEEPTVPTAERFYGTVMVSNAPRTGIMRITVTIERWTTIEERKKLIDAIKAGGTDALVEAMDKLDAGYVQIDSNLRWPIRFAISWQTAKGRLVRFATNRPINFLESWNNTLTSDYPIGVIEVFLPLEGKGEGVLLAATKIRFNEQGRLEVQSLPTNTGPQKLSDVEVEKLKPEKSKKK